MNDDQSSLLSSSSFYSQQRHFVFQRVTYKERQFMKRIEKRHSLRNTEHVIAPSMARSAFHDTLLNINAMTTELSLDGQRLDAPSDRSLAALWTLLHETTGLKKVSLKHCKIYSCHAAALRSGKYSLKEAKNRAHEASTLHI